jgi:hypothetical protein
MAPYLPTGRDPAAARESKGQQEPGGIPLLPGKDPAAARESKPGQQEPALLTFTTPLPIVGTREFSDAPEGGDGGTHRGISAATQEEEFSDASEVGAGGTRTGFFAETQGFTQSLITAQEDASHAIEMGDTGSESEVKRPREPRLSEHGGGGVRELGSSEAGAETTTADRQDARSGAETLEVVPAGELPRVPVERSREWVAGIAEADSEAAADTPLEHAVEDDVLETLVLAEELNGLHMADLMAGFEAAEMTLVPATLPERGFDAVGDTMVEEEQRGEFSKEGSSGALEIDERMSELGRDYESEPAKST